jgi:hypothetical protein
VKRRRHLPMHLSVISKKSFAVVANIDAAPMARL